jgi:GDP-L-fucose synthase
LVYGDIPLKIKNDIGLSADSSRLTSKNPKVVLWGSGTAYREFLHVDDMAAACTFVMGDEEIHAKLSLSSGQSQSSFFNIGSGVDQTIKETALLIEEIVGFRDETVCDAAQPDGTPRKLLDMKRFNEFGWRPVFSLKQGLEDTYTWYLSNYLD